MIKQRRTYANYIDAHTGSEDISNRDTDFLLLGAGFKNLNEHPSAQTKSRRYICDKSESQSISGYSWSAPFEADQIAEEDAINFLCGIADKQAVGSDAESYFLIVDLTKYDPGAIVGDGVPARAIKVAIEISEYTSDDGDMGISGNFLGIGDMIEGKFNPNTRKFTPKGSK